MQKKVWTAALVVDPVQYSNRRSEERLPWPCLGMKKFFGQVFLVCTKAFLKAVVILIGMLDGTSYTELQLCYQ